MSASFTRDHFIQRKDKFSQLTAQQPLKISPNSSHWTVEAANYTATIHITIRMSVFARQYARFCSIDRQLYQMQKKLVCYLLHVCPNNTI